MKKLKEEKANLEKAAAASKTEEIMNFIATKGLNADEVLNVLRERFGNE